MTLKKTDAERRQNLITIVLLLAFMVICVAAAIFVRDSPVLVGIISSGQISSDGSDTTATPSLLEALDALNSPTPEITATPDVTTTPEPGILVKTMGIVRVIPGYTFFFCGGVGLIVILVLGGVFLIFPINE